MPLQSTCLTCGAAFAGRTSRVSLYCSRVCYRDRPIVVPTPNATCPECSMPFYLPDWKRREGRVFCTEACYLVSIGRPKPIDENRFWSKVDRSRTCWTWTGQVTSRGYGTFPHGRKKPHAHRIAWALVAGPMPDGMEVCHDCPGGDTRTCVRNDEPGIYVVNGIARPRFGHLWLGTHAENMADMYAKGRGASSEVRSEAVRRVARRGDDHFWRTHPDRIPLGEQTSGAKITADIVRMIRARYAAGGITQEQLGAAYGISRRQVSGIVRRTEWSHVQ